MEGNLGPLDLNKFKEIVRQESARLRLKAFSTEGESAFTLALALSAAVKKIFYEKSGTTFSSEPKLEKKPVTQFVHRMRIDAMEKFNATTVFSVIEFAASEEALQKQAFLVTLVIYLEQKFLPEFLRLLQYPYIDSDDEDEVRDGCGTLANVIAGQYKKELAVLGYKDFMMSPFDSYINTAADGVGIPNCSTEKFEISFDVEGTKRMVVEMVTLATLPKAGIFKKGPAKKVLVVDDDPVHVKAVSSLLESNGFQVLIARDGKEGVARLKEMPQVVILDLQMPQMDGYEFILAMKDLQGANKVSPVIIMTVKEGLGDIVKVPGVKEYMVKPFNPELLLSSIQRYL